MGSFPFILIFLGLLTAGGIFIWLRQREREQQNLNTEKSLRAAQAASENQAAVLVATEHGKLLHVNDRLRDWMGLNGAEPNLNDVRRMAQPEDHLLDLLAKESRVSLQFGERWVEATSHYTPARDGMNVVVVMRELLMPTQSQPGETEGMDVSRVMRIINEINETADASVGIEPALQVVLEILNRAIPCDAGELCIWNDEKNLLEQRGWIGDTRYLLTVDARGGTYQPGQGVAGWMAKYGKAMLIDGRHDPVAIKSLMSETPYTSAAGVPLFLSEHLVGTLLLYSEEARHFSTEDISLLQAVSKAVGTIIRNAQHYAGQESLIHDITTLQEIADQSGQGDPVARIYQLLTERVARLMNAEMCGVLLYDDERKVLVPQLPFFGLPHHISERFEIPLPLDTPQRDAWERQPYWVSNDLRDEPLTSALKLDTLVQTAGIRNTALFPMQIAGQRIGVIAISNKQGSGGFLPADLKQVRVIASQASIVVENVRLYQREQRIDQELLGLQTMTHAIGALSHEGEFFSEITSRVAELMGSQMCGILLYDDISKALVARLPFYGVDEDAVRDYMISLAPGTVMEQVWDEEDVWLSNRVRTDSLVYAAGLEDLAERLGVQKTLMATMSAGGRRIGVVQIANKLDGTDYDDRDGRLMQIFAAQAGAIIENARLVREVQVRAEQADRLRRIAEMTTRMISAEESFEPVLREIAALLDCEAVYVNVIDHNTNTLIGYPRWTYGMDVTEPVVQDLTQPGYEQIPARTGYSFVTNNISDDKRVLPGYQRLAERFGHYNAILVPLMVGDRIIGEMGAANRRAGDYTPQDLATFTTVAAQVAPSIERMQLFEAAGENLRRRVEELDAIARVSNKLALTDELQTVLDAIRVEAARATYADGSTVVLMRPEQEWRAGDKPEMLQRIGEINGPYGLAPLEREAALQGAEPVVVQDYNRHTSIAPMPADARSALAVGVLYLDQVVGLIHVYSRRPRAFDERSSGFLLQLSTKTSLAYRNDLLYKEQLEKSERLRQRVDQLNRIFELGQMVQTNADPVMMLEAIAYSVQHSVGFDTVLMLLFDEEDENVLRRVAQAGMPLDRFHESQSLVIRREELDGLLVEEYRSSESYFFPIEELEKWYRPSISVLSAEYEGNRSVEPLGKRWWHDGDMLLVSIRGQGGELLGLMSLDRPYNNQRPERRTLEVLEIFAHQAATMLENTRLFRQSQQNAAQEARLSNMLESIAGTLDYHDLAERLASGLRELVDFDLMTLVLYDEVNEHFDHLTAGFNPSGHVVVQEEQQATLQGTALGRSYSERAIYAYEATDADARHYEDLRAWQQRGEQSTIILPLSVGGLCLGVLHLGRTQAGAFQHAETEQLLARTVQLVASTVQNARLFNQALNLQVLNRSVVESIQQGIVVLDNASYIISINEFMRSAYGWDDSARGQNLFVYEPNFREYLQTELLAVLEDGQPRARIGQTTPSDASQIIVRNFYIYPLRYEEDIRGAVLLVDDVTERAKLEEAIETRANQLAALTEVSTRITASLERQEVIDLAMDEMGWIIPFDMMTMWRRNGSYMALEGATRSDGTPFDVPGKRIRINEYPSVMQLVESQRVVNVDDYAVIPHMGIPGDREMRSWMGVPLVNQGHVVGMFILMKRSSNSYNTRQEHHVAFAFASQVAIALANADLFEHTFERTNELGTLLEAAQATSLTRDLNEVFRTVAELMFSVLDMQTCAIMIWDDVDGELEVQFSSDRDGDELTNGRLRERYDLVTYPAREQALMNREVVVIVATDDPERQPPYPYELDEMRASGEGSRMIVPLVVRDEAIGLIQLGQQSNDEDSVTQQKVRLARALGSQVAVAIQNARLTTETTARFEELLTINSLSQSISSTLKLEDMLPIIRDQVPQITSAEEMYLALYSPETNKITFPLATRRNGESFVIPDRELGNDEVSYIIKNKRALSLGADYFSPEELRRSMHIDNGEGDIKSYMGVPLKSGNDVLGVLAVRNVTNPRAFSINDDRILTTVGSQLGAAIQNARLFERLEDFAENLQSVVDARTDELEEERDRLDTLYQITSELARTLDMEQLLDRSLGMVCKAIGADDGVIFLNNPRTEELVATAYLDPNYLLEQREDGTAVHPAHELAMWFLRNEDTAEDYVILINNLNEHEAWADAARSTGLNSAIAVILESNDEPMGVLVLLGEAQDAFNESHLKLLVPAANQVAASINSADLYQLIREQAERMGRLLRAEQESAKKNSAILEAIADGVMLADSEGKIVLFNNAAERILELPRSQAIGQPVSKLAGLYGSSAARWIQLIDEWSDAEEDLPDGEVAEAERITLGDRIISAQLAPVFIGGDFLGTVSVFRDITRDVEADRAKSKFIENVSHEFRTPLTPIKGYADLLLSYASNRMTQSDLAMVETIKENADRLTVLVNDVLNISKVDSGDDQMHAVMVDVAEVANQVVSRVERRPTNKSKALQTEVDISSDVPFIRADRDKLARILENIVENAFNYTPAGGSINVRVRRLPDNKHIEIVVEDSGVGIPEEFREAAWRRFERYDQHAVDLDVAGTGLGLPLARDLVRLHHGDIWFESEVGVGTTFFIKLPIEQPSFRTSSYGLPEADETESVAGD